MDMFMWSLATTVGDAKPQSTLISTNPFMSLILFRHLCCLKDILKKVTTTTLHGV